MNSANKRTASGLARVGMRALAIAIGIGSVTAAGAVVDHDRSLASADPPSYTIPQLQTSSASLDWKSPHQGEIVQCTGGIVTHKFSQRIVLQDPSAGNEWAAIEVRGYPVYPTGISVGDSVVFTNVYVDEYRGVTTLQYYSASSHTVISSGHPLPDPLPVPVWNLRYPAHPEDAERYAAMLVSLTERVTIGARDLGKNGDNYEIVSDLGDTAWGSDYGNMDIDSTYYVASGQCYQRLTGILQRYDNDAEWDYYQLLPRSIGDYVPCSIDVPEDAPENGIRWHLVGPSPSDRGLGIVLDIASAVPLSVTILDSQGRAVRTLEQGLAQAGHHEIFWDGRDATGRAMASGVYFVRLDAASRTAANARDGQVARSARICLVR